MDCGASYEPRASATPSCHKMTPSGSCGPQTLQRPLPIGLLSFISPREPANGPWCATRRPTFVHPSSNSPVPHQEPAWPDILGRGTSLLVQRAPGSMIVGSLHSCTTGYHLRIHRSLSVSSGLVDHCASYVFHQSFRATGKLSLMPWCTSTLLPTSHDGNLNPGTDWLTMNYLCPTPL